MIIKQTLLQDPRDAEDAVKALDGTELCGMIAHVEMAKVAFFYFFFGNVEMAKVAFIFYF